MISYNPLEQYLNASRAVSMSLMPSSMNILIDVTLNIITKRTKVDDVVVTSTLLLFLEQSSPQGTTWVSPLRKNLDNGFDKT